jgi:multidrug efflux pump subunit AcrA (membrane-fusion protein)
VAGIVGALALVLVAANGILSRHTSEAKLKEYTEVQAVPTVSLISPITGANKSSLDLPGRLEAYARAPIYARVGGFLKAWYVDIGAPVKAGQLLAEIEAPDLDQQLLQAKAALASAQAAEALATVTAQRWSQLGGANTVSRQTVDEKLGDLTVKQALTRAARPPSTGWKSCSPSSA